MYIVGMTLVFKIDRNCQFGKYILKLFRNLSDNYCHNQTLCSLWRSEKVKVLGVLRAFLLLECYLHSSYQGMQKRVKLERNGGEKERKNTAEDI
jgi:hypothetical protein